MTTPGAGPPLAIEGATLWTMTADTALRSATVVIEEGRIAAVGEGLPTPAGARVIAADGAVVTPGLMNGATQLGYVEVGSLDDAWGQRADKREDEIVDVRYALNANSMLLPVARADGLTRALVFPRRPDGALFAGRAAVIRLSDDADILDLAEAAVVATIGEIGANPPSVPRAAGWRRLRQALDGAKTKADHAEAAVLAKVLERRTPLMIQAGRESDVRQAADLARDYGIRVIVFGAAEAWRAAGLLAERGIAVVLNPFDNIPASLDAFGARSDNAAILARAGVPIAFAVPGIHLSHNAGSALREAAGLAVANGLPWRLALRALTADAADMFGIGERHGRIAVGLEADLVIWDGDPLEPASSPTAVIVGGEPMSLATRQTMLRDRYRPQENPWPPAYR